MRLLAHCDINKFTSPILLIPHRVLCTQPERQQVVTPYRPSVNRNSQPEQASWLLLDAKYLHLPGCSFLAEYFVFIRPSQYIAHASSSASHSTGATTSCHTLTTLRVIRSENEFSHLVDLRSTGPKMNFHSNSAPRR